MSVDERKEDVGNDEEEELSVDEFVQGTLRDTTKLVDNASGKEHEIERYN